LDDGLLVPVDQRNSWVDGLPTEHADLKSELRVLLARASVETDGFMRKPVRLRGTASGVVLETAIAQAGMVVGPFRLLREIGVGGMGAVWLAERADGMLRRRVALKLPRLNWDTAGLADRMARERDILGDLEHPNIARLYDAGVDAHGRPYLAMEYVEGQPLDAYCNERGLAVRDRLELFLQVARAVTHAHARLIVHRDLKPSNILVTGEGDVRLLDFGIAKLIQGDTGAESASESRLTRLAGRALTPEYASPEQIRGEAITVAVDVYSLGIVLYELLTGQRPYRLDSSSTAALEDAVLRVDAPTASTVALDKARARQLRGDLDTILAKALKKVPSERYATVDAFAADVQRHLAGTPVLARPDSVVYRVSRFVRRHKVPVGVAALVVLAVLGGAAPVAAVMIALAAGTGAALWQAGIARRQAKRAAEEARQAQRERDRAVALIERHEATLEFIQIMLTEAAEANEHVTLNELLERSEKLALPGTENPEQQGSVLDLLASFWISFGNYGKAESLLRHAIELVRRSTDATLRAQIECNYALALSECGNVENGRRIIEGWLACQEVEPHIAALCQQYLAQIARNHNDAKGALDNVLGAQARLRTSRRKLPSFEASLAGDIAYAYHLNGRTEEADRQYAMAMQLYRDLGRDESPAAVAILNNWGLACMGAGDVKRALALNEEVLRVVTKRSPNATPPPYAVNNRAATLNALGRLGEAWAEAERAWVVADQAGAAVFKLNARVMQAAILRERGDLDSASRILTDVAPSAAELPADSFAVIAHQQGCATIALRRGRFVEAALAIEPVIRLFEERDMRIGVLITALRLRAEIRWGQGNLAAAVTDARRALAIAEDLRGTNPCSSFTGLCSLLLARLERASGNLQEADAARRNAVVHLSGALGDEHPESRLARQLFESAPADATTPHSG
jgi:serine/threonine-protein kinase